MKDLLKDLTIKLSEIPSISGNEYACLTYLCDFLSKNGLIVEKIPVDKNRFNIFAYKEYRDKYTAIFCTHIDTVSPFFSPYIKKDIIFGRGACDAKGILATMCYVVIKEAIPDISLLITVGEEEASDGAKVASKILSNRAHYLIVGEPTEKRYASAQKGMLVFDLKSKGIEAHSSISQFGRSAVHILIKDMHELINYKWPKNKDLGDTLINVGVIDGGKARNMLAKEAKAQAIMRLSVSTQEILNTIKNIISSEVDLSILSKSEPFKFFVPPNKLTFVAGFGSDAPYLMNVGKVILMGPGKLQYAHSMEEQINVDELYQGFLEYRDLIYVLRAII